jgi:hypothetical protein
MGLALRRLERLRLSTPLARDVLTKRPFLLRNTRWDVIFFRRRLGFLTR